MASSSNLNSPQQQQANDLQATQKLLRATLDSSMDMIQVFEAVRDQQGEIIDFIWLLNNHTSEKIYGDVVGKSLLQLQPGVVEEGIFDAFKQVVETGKPQQYEKHYVHEQFDGWFHQSVVRLNDGVATTTSDITSRKKAEEQLKQNQAFLQSIIDSSLDTIQVFKAVRNERGDIRDFVWAMNNQKAVGQNGDVIGKSLLKRSPGVVPTGIFDHMVEVAQTGIAYEHEQYYDQEQFDGWFYQALVKTDGGVTMTTRDITQAKLAEQQILRLKDEIAQKATDKYLTLFNSIYQGFARCELIRDANGNGVDYRILELNPAFEKQTGISRQTLLGRTAYEAFPTIDQWWIETFTTLVDSGKSISFDHHLKEVQRWYEIGAYPMPGNQFAVLYNDITERKQRETGRELLISIAQDLGQLTDETDIIRAVGAKLAAHLGITCCHYVDIDEDRDEVTVRHFWHALEVPPILGTYPLRAFVSPEALAAWRAGKPTIINDIAREMPDGTAEAAVLKAGAAAQKISAFIAVGLSQEGKWKAYFALADSRPRAWTAVEIDLVQEVAGQLLPRIERVRAEEALRQSQKRFESIANLVPDLLWDSEPDGSTNWYNQRWLEYTGQRFEQAIGWGWTDAIHPDDRAGSAKRYGEAVDAGKLLRQEHRIRHHDGAYRWFVVSALPLKDEKGQVVKMYGAATDIHDRRQTEEALKQADRRKDEFMALLAHELRNPLATLSNTLLLLHLTKGQDTSLPLDKALTMMSQEVTQLTRLVDDLLDVSRINQHKTSLRLQPLELGKLVHQIAESIRLLTEQQQLQFIVRLPAHPLYVLGDEIRLTQILRNLLGNAAKFTQEKGHVWLSMEQVEQEAVLRVKDDGIGIPADQLVRIFEQFAQVDGSISRSQGGLGLGLTLAQHFTHLHGGRLEAYSQGLGQGSEFVVYLPLLNKT